jgi:hypothetical protein
MDGYGRFFFNGLGRNRGAVRPSMAGDLGGPSSSYGASYATRSRRREGSVLPTYRCGNGSREAINRETTQSVHEDDGGNFRCSFGSGDGGIDGGPSFKRRLDSGGLDSVGRQRKLGWLWRLGLGRNLH